MGREFPSSCQALSDKQLRDSEIGGDLTPVARHVRIAHHYVNLPTGSTAFDLDRDCAALDCAVVAIQRYARYIALPRSSTSSRERERRVLALRFLGHFVGDLHQPLHVGFAEDLGGNRINVLWDTGPSNISKNLHSVWDSEILRRAGLTSQTQDGPILNAEITQAELTQWRNFNIAQWAEEPFVLARTRAYAKHDGTSVMDGDLLSAGRARRA
jgi:hypothetical protein